MTFEPHVLPYHPSQTEAILSLLKAHPDGVTRRMFLNYLYRTKGGRTVGLWWECRARLADLRHDYHIDHVTLDGESAWVLRGPKVEPNGQQLLPVFERVVA